MKQLSILTALLVFTTLAFVMAFSYYNVDFMSTFMAHGMCFYWRPDILISSVLGNTLTFIAYLIIPGFIYVFSKEKNLPKSAKNLLMLIALFILFCGIGHIIHVSTIWTGNYQYQALWDMLTGIVSVTTTVVLIQNFGKILSLPTPKDVENEYLLAELHRQATFDGVMVHEHGVIKEINDVMLELMNTSREVIINTAPLVHITSIEEFHRIQRIIESGSTAPYEATLIPFNKTEPVHVLIQSKNLKQEAGPALRVTIVRNITQEKNLFNEIKKLGKKK